MANEAVLIFETGLPIPFTVAEDATIEKGAVLKLSTPMTAASADGSGNPVAGIAASEKIADDGKVRLGVYREGIFKMTISGSVSAGDPVSTVVTHTNYVYKAPTNEEDLLGTVLEDATTGQTALVELKPFGVSLA